MMNIQIPEGTKDVAGRLVQVGDEVLVKGRFEGKTLVAKEIIVVENDKSKEN